MIYSAHQSIWWYYQVGWERLCIHNKLKKQLNEIVDEVSAPCSVKVAGHTITDSWARHRITRIIAWWKRLVVPSSLQIMQLIAGGAYWTTATIAWCDFWPTSHKGDWLKFWRALLKLQSCLTNHMCCPVISWFWIGNKHNCSPAVRKM
jgi:hypothetical protein